jgi:hypothetical protein
MVEKGKIRLFRMMHINNVSHVLKHGITHINSVHASPNFVPIGDASLINNRNRHQLFNGKSLGDYIPFYFGVKMPMLYVIQKGFNAVPALTPQHII